MMLKHLAIVTFSGIQFGWENMRRCTYSCDSLQFGSSIVNIGEFNDRREKIFR